MPGITSTIPPGRGPGPGSQVAPVGAGPGAPGTTADPNPQIFQNLVNMLMSGYNYSQKDAVEKAMNILENINSPASKGLISDANYDAAAPIGKPVIAGAVAGAMLGGVVGPSPYPSPDHAKDAQLSDLQRYSQMLDGMQGKPDRPTSGKKRL